MAIEVDFERRVVRASVRELASRALGARGGQLPGRLLAVRARLGQELHRRARARVEADGAIRWRFEVPVKLVRQVDGFEAHLRGRVDAWGETPQGLLIDEIKSVLGSGADLYDDTQLAEGALDDWLRQARLYALCAARSEAKPEQAVRAQLTLIAALDETERTLPCPFDAEATEQELDQLLRDAIAGAEQARERASWRAAAADRIAFPYPRARRHQVELIEFIADGLRAGRPVVAMAPTGIGKTVTALVPALRFALREDARVFFATAKNTQQELVERTFVDVAGASDPDLQLSAVTLRAKERMCPPGTLDCRAQACPYLRDYARRAAECGATDRLLADSPQVSPDRIYALGRALELCPFELSMDLAERADLVIGDYNYIYDRRAGEDEAAARSTVVVVDEAHNLFDRARGYWSCRVGLGQVKGARAALPMDAAPPLRADLQRWLTELDDAMTDEFMAATGADPDGAHSDDTAARRAGFVEDSAPHELAREPWAALADSAARLLMRYLLDRRRQRASALDPVSDLLREVQRLAELLESEEPELVEYAAGPDAPRGLGAGVLCVNPARRLARLHAVNRGTVAISATLTPIDYYAEVLGFGDMHPRTTSAPSPFPEEHRLHLIAPQVSTRFRVREENAEPIAKLISDLIDVRPGPYIAYFSSFAFMGLVRSRMRLPASQLLVQMPEMPELLRTRMLDRLRSAGTGRSTLLLAVLGGIFSEGVDLPGQQLIGSFIVGPGLPPVGFERAVMRHYYDERNGAGFAYAMLYPGMQRVIQAAGRVIRTDDDRGVIALIGERFADPAYADCLPAHWYRTSPRELIADDPIERARAFWRDH